MARTEQYINLHFKNTVPKKDSGWIRLEKIIRKKNCPFRDATVKDPMP